MTENERVRAMKICQGTLGRLAVFCVGYCRFQGIVKLYFGHGSFVGTFDCTEYNKLAIFSSSTNCCLLQNAIVILPVYLRYYLIRN